MKLQNIILVFTLLIAISTASCTASKDSANAINEDVFIKTKDTKLFANIRGVDKSTPILLYLHGGPGSPLGIPIFKAYSGYQLEKDFIVVYLHQRGIMKSERVADNAHTVSNYVQDIHYVVSYLKNRFQGQKIFLMGHSWGGLISYMYLLDYEGEVDKFVAVCTPLNSSKMLKGRIEMILQWALNTNNQQAIDELKVLQNNSLNLSEEESAILVKWMSKANGGWNRNLEFKKINDAVNYENKFPEWLKEQKHIESLLKDEILNIDLTDSIKNIYTPLLCLTGKEDTSVPWYIVKKEFENYAGPKEFKLFENSHHMVFIDEEELFVETVTNFLKEKN
ncbi:alpha/beta hydrolase [Maribellus mangrovi]|uniref:alpha/beta hydrolase n=1 Tax=Maribellus mangrovi TaxID=3133146 RepID=UPI0030EB8B18